MDKTREILLGHQKALEGHSKALQVLGNDIEASRDATLCLVTALIRFLRNRGDLKPEDIRAIIDLAGADAEGRALALIESVRAIVNSDPPAPPPPTLRIILK